MLAAPANAPAIDNPRLLPTELIIVLPALNAVSTMPAKTPSPILPPAKLNTEFLEFSTIESNLALTSLSAVWLLVLIVDGPVSFTANAMNAPPSSSSSIANVVNCDHQLLVFSSPSSFGDGSLRISSVPDLPVELASPPLFSKVF